MYRDHQSGDEMIRLDRRRHTAFPKKKEVFSTWGQLLTGGFRPASGIPGQSPATRLRSNISHLCSCLKQTRLLGVCRNHLQHQHHHHYRCRLLKTATSTGKCSGGISVWVIIISIILVIVIIIIATVVLALLLLSLFKF